MTKALVLGGTGFIGAALTAELSRRGIPVAAHGSHTLDLASPSAGVRLRRLMDRSTIVFFLSRAPYSSAPWAGFAGDVAILATAAAALRSGRARKWIYMSSTAIFGASRSNRSIHEDAPLAPQSPYAASKVLGERLLGSAAADGGSPLLVLRPPMVYGPGDAGAAYGPGQFIRSLIEKGEMRLFGDGGELRDLLYVDDLARVAVDLALGPRIGDFNVAGGAILHLRRPSQVPESAGRQGSDRPGRSSHREDGSAARRVEAAPRAAPRALHAARHGPLGGVSRRARSPFGLVSTVSRPVVRRFFIGRTCSRVIKPESEGKMWLECQTTVTLPSLSPTEVRHPRLPQNESFTSRLSAIAASLAVRACAAGVSSPSDRTAKSDGQCHRYSG